MLSSFLIGIGALVVLAGLWTALHVWGREGGSPDEPPCDDSGGVCGICGARDACQHAVFDGRADPAPSSVRNHPSQGEK